MKEGIKKILDKKVVVHIKTTEQLRELNKVLFELGLSTLSGSYEQSISRGDFCVNVTEGLWCERDYYINLHYKVIEFEDLCKKNTIVIYNKGNETIALDKSTGKKAVAKCSPQDKFDFYTGAKLALDRLTKNVTFRVLAVKNDREPLSLFHKGDVFEFVDGVTTWCNGTRSSYYDNYNDLIARNVTWRRHFIELKEGDNPKEILKKYNTIKVGDTVKVINNGKTYTTFASWLERNISKRADRYAWDYCKTPTNDDIGKVIAIHPYSVMCDKDMLAYVEIKGRCYIIGVEGLEKC